MLPYWIELSLADLMQGTAVIAIVVSILSLQFLLPTSRS